VYRLTQRKGRCIQISYDDGKTWTSTGCHTKEEARRKLRLGMIGIFEVYAKDFYTRTDIDSFRYRSEARGKRLSNNLISSSQYRLDNVIIPYFGRMNISDITARDIEGWFMRLKKPDGTAYSNQTKNSILSEMRQILDNAVLDGLAETNEARKIKCYSRITRQMGSISKKELDLLFPEDDEKLISNFQNNIYRTVYFSIFKDTGFRPSEIMALRYSDIKEDGTVYTEWIWDFHDKKLDHRIKTSNKGKKYKVGTLSHQTMRLIARTDNKKYILLDNKEEYDYQNLNRYFKNAVYNVLRRTDLTQYCLRHAFMTNLISKYPKELIMELMGHTQWESCYDDRTPEMIINNLRNELSRYQPSR